MPDDIREAIEMAMNDIGGESAADEPSFSESETQETASHEEETDFQPENSDRPRDDKGRFVKKEGEDEGEVQVSDHANEEGGEEAATVQPIQAPNSWSAAEKEFFSTLPLEVQNAIARRESDREKGFTQKSQELADVRTKYQQLDEVLSPYRAQWGDNLTNNLRELMQISEWANRDPRGFMEHFAKSNGIDLSSSHEAQATQEVNPEVAELRQRLNHFERLIQQQQQSAQLETRNEAQTQVERFRDTVDESGNLKHPYFEDVRAYMGALMEAGVAKDLSDAYEQAVRANPVTFDKVREQEKIRQIAEQRKKVEKAKKAGVSANGAPAGFVPKSYGNMELRDLIESVWDEQSGSV